MSIGLIIHVLILALAFLSVAYLVYAAAQKLEGLMKSVGTVLAAILAAIGALALIGHLSAPMTGGHPFGIDMEHGAQSAPGTTTTPGTAAPSEGAKPSGGDGSSETPAAEEEGAKP